MTTQIYHPGIQNEYFFSSWEEAREKLTEWHGGLASGMLFNCREVELNEKLRKRLEDAGFEDSGREYATTASTLGQSFDGEEYDYCPAEDKKEIARFIKLSPKKWAKGFYTDAVGNPCLIWVARWGQE